MFQFWVAVETNQISDSKTSLYKYNALNNNNYNYKVFLKILFLLIKCINYFDL